MSQFEINAHRASLGDVRHRKNINNFSDAEIDSIRAAHIAVYGITNRDDNRGYHFRAGKLGCPEADRGHAGSFRPGTEPTLMDSKSVSVPPPERDASVREPGRRFDPP